MDIHRIAEIVKGQTPAGPRQPLRLRQGTVVAHNGDGTVDVTIAGSTAVVAGVQCFDSVNPEEGHGIWLLTDGVDLIAVGTIGATP
jgi:hypothetical protein